MKTKKILIIAMALITLLNTIPHSSYAAPTGTNTTVSNPITTNTQTVLHPQQDMEEGSEEEVLDSGAVCHLDTQATTETNTSIPADQDMEDNSEEKVLDSGTDLHIDMQATAEANTSSSAGQYMSDENSSSTNSAPSTSTLIDKAVDKVEQLLNNPDSENLKKFLADNGVLKEDGTLNKEALKEKIQNHSIEIEKLTDLVMQSQPRSGVVRQREDESEKSTDTKNSSTQDDTTSEKSEKNISSAISITSTNTLADDSAPQDTAKTTPSEAETSAPPKKKRRCKSKTFHKSEIQVYTPDSHDEIIGDDKSSKDHIEEIRKQMSGRPIIAICPKTPHTSFATLKDLFTTAFTEVTSKYTAKPIIYFGGNICFTRNSTLSSTDGINADIIICGASFLQSSFHDNKINGMCILFHPNMNTKECFKSNITTGCLFIVGNSKYYALSEHYPIAPVGNTYYLSGNGLMSQRCKVEFHTLSLERKFSDTDKVSFSDTLNFAIKNSNPTTQEIIPRTFMLKEKTPTIPPLQRSVEEYVTIYTPANANKYNPYDQDKLKAICDKMPERTIIAVCSPVGITDAFHFSDIEATLMVKYNEHCTSSSKSPIIYFGHNIYFKQQALTNKAFNADIIICSASFAAQAFHHNIIHGMCILFNPRVNATSCFFLNTINNGLFVVGSYEKAKSSSRYSISNISQKTWYLFGNNLLYENHKSKTISSNDFSETLETALSLSKSRSSSTTSPSSSKSSLAPIVCPKLPYTNPETLTPESNHDMLDVSEPLSVSHDTPPTSSVSIPKTSPEHEQPADQPAALKDTRNTSHALKPLPTTFSLKNDDDILDTPKPLPVSHNTPPTSSVSIP